MKIQKELEQKIVEALKPVHFELLNESYMHSVPEGSESHFKAVIASEEFVNKRLVQQHQLVYQVLGDSMQKIHALVLHTYTVEQWQNDVESPKSPDCLGGSKSN